MEMIVPLHTLFVLNIQTLTQKEFMKYIQARYNLGQQP